MQQASRQLQQQVQLQGAVRGGRELLELQQDCFLNGGKVSPLEGSHCGKNTYFYLALEFGSASPILFYSIQFCRFTLSQGFSFKILYLLSKQIILWS